MEAKKKRIELLDELRGFAILAMIVHHFFLDVGDILQLDWGYKIFNELCTVQPIFGQYSSSYRAYAHDCHETQSSED